MANGHGHGHTPAAWTGVIIAFIGFCVASAFIVMAKPVGFWAGIVIIFLGAIVGGIMRLMGLGAEPRGAKAPAKAQAQG
ncbi:HGxxPAAW family protein [Streptomyces sp. NPDC052396]|uniref:HGxxPAAW family protein n=1 Tax=Streptomyces sp. NPDC052396 TaxID=3365689 RepID=UPI0037D6C881